MSDDGDVAVPLDIECNDQVFDVDFHPSGNFIAAGCISGSVEVWKHDIGLDVNKRVMDCNPHEGSCRGLSFDSLGQRLLTISSDKFLRVMDDSGKEVLKFHTGDDKLNKMLLLDDNGVVTGDDSGCVKLWDLRVDNSNATTGAMEWNVHQDYVSSFCHCPDKNNTLLSGSGDGTIAVYDLRKPSTQSVIRSEDQEAEITCIQTMKYGKKVMCGTQDGVMLIFSWGKWLDQSDRYPGHPETVDCCVKIDEKTMLTGSSDGLIRAIQFHPNKLLGVLGSHDDFPVEGMRKNHDDTLIASYAHDPIIRFNDISVFYDMEEEEEEKKKGGKGKKESKNKNKKSAAGAEEDDEEGWESAMSEDEDEEIMADPLAMDEPDDNDDDDDTDDSDSDDEGGPKIPKFKTEAESFFEDM